MSEENKRGIFSLSIESRELYEYMRRGAVPGKMWTYDELNAAAKTDVRAHSCLRTARRMLERENIVTDAVPGEGIKVLNDSETVRTAQKDLQSISRKSRRAVGRVTSVEYDRLSEDDKIVHNTHLTQLLFVKHSVGVKLRRSIEGKVSESHSRLPISETLKLFSNGKSED